MLITGLKAIYYHVLSDVMPTAMHCICLTSDNNFPRALKSDETKVSKLLNVESIALSFK